MNIQRCFIQLNLSFESVVDRIHYDLVMLHLVAAVMIISTLRVTLSEWVSEWVSELATRWFEQRIPPPTILRNDNIQFSINLMLRSIISIASFNSWLNLHVREWVSAWVHERVSIIHLRSLLNSLHFTIDNMRVRKDSFLLNSCVILY